jgi:hypothetical protein
LSLFDDYCSETVNIFYWDWSHTKNMLAPPYVDELISSSGTFLYPNVNDEYNDWGSRGGLLDSYKKLMKEWVSYL